jgi:hypothetical protein
MTSACCLHNFVMEYVCMRKFEHRVQIVDQCAPWKIFNSAKKLISQALQFKEAACCRKFPGSSSIRHYWPSQCFMEGNLTLKAHFWVGNRLLKITPRYFTERKLNGSKFLKPKSKLCYNQRSAGQFYWQFSFWGPRPDFYYCEIGVSFLMWWCPLWREGESVSF